MDGPLIDYKAKGHTVELLGKDKVEGTDCYKLKVTLKNGDVRTYLHRHRELPRGEGREPDDDPRHRAARATRSSATGRRSAAS